MVGVAALADAIEYNRQKVVRGTGGGTGSTCAHCRAFRIAGCPNRSNAATTDHDPSAARWTRCHPLLAGHLVRKDHHVRSGSTKAASCISSRRRARRSSTRIEFKDLDQGRYRRRLSELRHRPCGVEGEGAATVDNAQMRYFIVHLHRLLDPARRRRRRAELSPHSCGIIRRLARTRWVQTPLGRPCAPSICGSSSGEPQPFTVEPAIIYERGWRRNCRSSSRCGTASIS